MIADTVHPVLQPIIESFSRPCRLMILEIKIIVAARESLGGRRKRSEGFVYDAGNDEARNHRTIGVAENHVMLDDFLAAENHFLGCQGCLAHDAEVAPRVSVAFGVRALDMQDCNIGLKSADRE